MCTETGGTKFYIRMISDPKVRERIKEFVNRPHPDEDPILAEKRRANLGHGFEAKFTDAECTVIRNKYRDTPITAKELADEYGCGLSTMSKILRGEAAYNHIGRSVTKRWRD